MRGSFGLFSRRRFRIMEAVGKNAKEKDVAAALRPYLDQHFGKVSEPAKRLFTDLQRQTWHVIVGSNFGSSVTSLAMRFLYFYVGSTAVLCFQTK